MRVWGVSGSHISRQLAHEGGNVVSPTHRPPFTQEVFLVLISVRGWVDPRTIVRPKGLCQWKIVMTLGVKETWLNPINNEAFCKTTLLIALHKHFRVGPIYQGMLRLILWRGISDLISASDRPKLLEIVLSTMCQGEWRRLPLNLYNSLLLKKSRTHC